MDQGVIVALTMPLLMAVVAAAILAAIVVPFYLHHRTKDRARLYEMLKQAQESSHPFSPELIRQIVGSPSPTREKDIRRGAILLAIAAGLFIPTLLTRPPADDEIRNAVILLLSPLISVLSCVGLTLVVLGLTLRRSAKD